MAANAKALRISGKEPVETSVKLDTQVRKKVSRNLTAMRAETAAEPERVFLNIENVRGLHDATALKVFVKDELVDTIVLFGARKATTAGGGHGNKGGLTFVLEISDVIDKLHLNDALDVKSLDVRIEPVYPVPEEANVTIGRIRVFRQGR
jgi:tyrosinase